MNNIIDQSIIAKPLGGLSSQGKSPSHIGTGGGFSDLIRKGAESAVDTMKQSEKVSAEAVAGNADLNDVVQSVTAAELTLQTVVAVRDRMVSALQEVLRMPI
jgi:flagellar hook-basal body complex protein FliE